MNVVAKHCLVFPFIAIALSNCSEKAIEQKATPAAKSEEKILELRDGNLHMVIMRKKVPLPGVMGMDIWGWIPNQSAVWISRTEKIEKDGREVGFVFDPVADLLSVNRISASEEQSYIYLYGGDAGASWGATLRISETEGRYHISSRAVSAGEFRDTNEQDRYHVDGDFARKRMAGCGCERKTFRAQSEGIEVEGKAAGFTAGRSIVSASVAVDGKKCMMPYSAISDLCCVDKVDIRRTEDIAEIEFMGVSAAGKVKILLTLSDGKRCVVRSAKHYLGGKVVLESEFKWSEPL